MDEYYQGAYSGPQMDEAIGKALNNGGLVPNVGKGINLLDNWYFVGGGSQQGGGQFPINQRGQAALASNGYGIDRLIIYGSGAALVSSGLSLPALTVPTQKLESPSLLHGIVLCFSALFTDGFLMTGAAEYLSSGTTYFYNNYPAEGQAYIDPTGSLQFYRVAASVCIAVKLELGDTQTLARQVNGQWVLNDVPNFQHELAKCQYYLKKLPSDFYLAGWVNQGGTSIHIPFDESNMRASTKSIIVQTSQSSVYVDGGGSRVLLSYTTDFSLLTLDDHILLSLTSAGQTKVASLKSHAVGLWSGGGYWNVLVSAELN